MPKNLGPEIRYFEFCFPGIEKMNRRFLFRKLFPIQLLLLGGMLFCGAEYFFDGSHLLPRGLATQVAYAADAEVPKVSKKADKKRSSRKSRRLRKADPVAHVIGKPRGSAKKELDSERALPDQLDVVLVVDTSNSMKRTDPERIRDQGAKLLARFLDSDDRLGVLVFDDRVRLSRPLEPVVKDNLTAFDKVVDEIQISGGWTNLDNAVREAQQLLMRSGRKDAQHHVILLSDGTMDPHPRDGSPEALITRLLDQTLNRYSRAGIKLHTLALSSLANRELLAEMAKRVGGKHWYAPNGETIHESYSELFLVLKKPQITPLGGTEFLIDGHVQEVSFYIARSSQDEIVQLRSPDDVLMKHESHPETVHWYHGQMFDFVTIANPTSGIWKVEGVTTPQGYAKLLTKLQLQINDVEDRVNQGDTISVRARLMDEDATFDETALKDILIFRYEVVKSSDKELSNSGLMYDNGEGGDAIARDGIYSANVKFDQAGQFIFQVNVEAEQFKRQQQVPLTVSESMIGLEHKPYDALTEEDERYVVTLNKEAQKLKGRQVKLAAIQANDTKAFQVTLDEAEGTSGTYELLAKDLDLSPGSYRLEARLRGTDSRAKVIHAVSSSVPYVAGIGQSSPTEPELEPNDEVAMPAWFTHIVGSICLLTALGWCGFLWKRSIAKLSPIGAAEDELEEEQPVLIDEQILARVKELEQNASDLRRAPTEEDRKLFEILGDVYDDIVATSGNGASESVNMEDAAKSKDKTRAPETDSVVDQSAGDADSVDSAEKPRQT